MAKKQTSRSTLGVRMRGALAELYGQRGRGNAHLWFFYSDKGRDDFVVPTDLQYGHALFVESEPRIKSVSFRPPLRRVGGEGASTIFHAEATCFDGSIELHEVKPWASLNQSVDAHAKREVDIQLETDAFKRERGVDVRHVLMTERDIYASPGRIRSWFVALPWIAQARYHSLLQPSNEVATLVHARERVSLGHLLDAGGPLYVAAALRFIANGRFASDLDTVLFSRRTIVEDKRRRGRSTQPRTA